MWSFIRNVVSRAADTVARNTGTNGRADAGDTEPFALVSSDDATQEQGEGAREARISVHLARRCAVGTGLLELRDGEDPHGATTLEGSEERPLAVPGVPATVPASGISALDAWASRVAEEAAMSDWLPSFLTANSAHLPAAAVAASFLGCQAFLDMYMEVQLLRVALMEDAELSDAGAGRKVVPPLSSLKEEDFKKLPCCQRQPETQQAPTADEAAGAGAKPTEATTSEGGPAQQSEQRPAPVQVASLPTRRCSPAQFERLVAALMAGNLLDITGAPTHTVREALYRMGFRPVLAASNQEQISASQGRVAYLRLPLGGAGGDAASSGSDERQALSAGYQAEGVTVEVESHDQGWSSYPADHQTYRNSWTWGELLVVGPGGRRLREGDPGRLYTNLHAVGRWQTHAVTLPPDSQVVQDINACVFALPEERPAARPAAAGGEGHEQGGGGSGGAATSGDEARGELEGSEGSEGPQGERGCELILLACAAFPGWQNHVRRASLVVHLRPRSGPPLH